MTREIQSIPAYFTEVEYDFDEIDRAVCRAYLYNKYDGKTYEYIDNIAPLEEDFIEQVQEMLNARLLIEVSNGTFMNFEWV